MEEKRSRGEPTLVGRVAVNLMREVKAGLPPEESLNLETINICWGKAFAEGRAEVLMSAAEAAKPEGAILSEKEFFGIKVKAYKERGLEYPEPENPLLRRVYGLPPLPLQP